MDLGWYRQGPGPAASQAPTPQTPLSCYTSTPAIPSTGISFSSLCQEHHLANPLTLSSTVT